MKRFVAVLFAIFAIRAAAEPLELLLGTNGDVALGGGGAKLGLVVFKEGWSGAISCQPVLDDEKTERGDAAPEPTWSQVAFLMKDASGTVCVTGRVALSERGRPARDGALGERALADAALSLRATALADVRTECVAVGLLLPCAGLIGTEWRLGDGSRGVFPARPGETELHRCVADSFIYTDPKTGAPVTIRFPQPMRALVQDSRAWGPNFTVRFELPAPRKEKQIPRGTEIAFNCAISYPDGIAVERDEIVTIASGPDWIPLDLRKNIVAGSALDFSVMGFHDAPAGKHGWLKAMDGHFEFEGLPGVEQRFYGVNLCETANFPDHAMAEELVTRLKRLGYNSIRLHHHDNALADCLPTQSRRAAENGAGKKSLFTNPQCSPIDNKNSSATKNTKEHKDFVNSVSFVAKTNLDNPTITVKTTLCDSAALREESAIDRLDYLIAKCLDAGIYVTTDLYVFRKVAWRDIGFDRDGFVPNNVFKSLVALHEPAFENWASFARDFLLHENPYTGRRYVDEPGMPLLCLVNEGPMKWTWNDIRKMDCVKEKWREWGRNDDPASIGNFADSAAAQCFAAFVEREAFEREKAFLASLGCKALLTSQNCADNQAMASMRSAYDYVDNHFYHGNPQFLGTLWKGAFRFDGGNPAKAEGLSLVNAAFTRIVGKPYTITEWNFAGPSRHRAAGSLLAGAMAARQEWSGMWRFAYSHVERGLADGYGAPHLFDLAVDPVNLASERAVMCLFLRGDMAPLKTKVALDVGAPRIPQDGKPAANRPEWMDEAWRIQVGRVAGERPLFTNDNWHNCSQIANVNANVANVKVLPMPVSNAVNVGQNWELNLEDRPDFVLDREAGSVIVATPRTCGVFAEGGAHEAGPLRVEFLATKNTKERKEESSLFTNPQCLPIDNTNTNVANVQVLPMPVPNVANAGQDWKLNLDTGNIPTMATLSNSSAPLRLCVENNPATVFATSLDGAPLETSSRILVTHLTDAQAEGNVYAGRVRDTLLRWGKGRTLVRNGAARVSLALDHPESCEVWGLATDGARMERIEATAENGRLSFTADVDSGRGARLFYEIWRKP